MGGRACCSYFFFFMNTTIISAVTCSGKTYTAEKYKNKYRILDADRHYDVYVSQKDYPYNYINFIKEKYESGLYDYIFIGSEYKLRRALYEINIPYIRISPDCTKEIEEEWDKRISMYKDSKYIKAPFEYITMIFPHEISAPYKYIQLKSGQYLSDILHLE